MSSLFESTYNPDVLSCIANLSNDEVFTPPEVANQVLDMLPNDLWSNPDAKFLDPATKSGVFLREIAKRLIEGLENTYPDLEERLEHIYKNQLFGIATTELTSLMSRRSLYCSKYPSSKYSIVRFDKPTGNIEYQRIRHTWSGGKCIHCGAVQAEYERDETLEHYAYGFIHELSISEVLSMKFDVIVGNPPYQLSDGGFSISAKPIYHLFVERAKKLQPRYIAMIIPARWYSGGKGLDKFRSEMLSDDRLCEIHDFPDASDVFPGVQIKGGICYFLWSRDHSGNCDVYNHQTNAPEEYANRPLLEEGCETFIRWNQAVDILQKVLQAETDLTFHRRISARKPFGLNTQFHGLKTKTDVLVYENGGTSYIKRKDIPKAHDLIDVWKIFIPRAGSGSDAFPHPILGKPFIGSPGTICSETYMVIGPFANRDEAKNALSYIATKFFRFLVLLHKSSQDATSKVYAFVPDQDYTSPWSDKALYEKYRINEEEQAFIDTLIRPMEFGE